MARVVLDSSVLIALTDSDDIHHQIAVRETAKKSEWLSSTISLAETLINPARKSPSRSDQIRKGLGVVVGEFLPVTEEVAIAAAQIRAETGLKLPDAIIAATAQLTRGELWTFDAKLAKVTPGARCLA